MSLSLEIAQQIANTFRVDFGRNIDVKKDAPAWRDALADAGLTDDIALEVYKRFRSSWTKSATPRLNDLANFIRTSPDVAWRNVRPRNGLQRARCALCDGTGLIPCALPVPPNGGHLRPIDGFEPGIVWTESKVYPISLPCKCTAGRRYVRDLEMRTTNPSRWLEVRDGWVDYYAENSEEGPPALWQLRYLRACHETRQRVLNPPPQEHAFGGVPDVPDDEIPF